VSTISNKYISNQYYYNSNKPNAPDSGDFNPADYIVDDNDKVDINEFFTLMAAQLSSQDMFNPVDNTQFLAQLAQFTTMENMQQLTYSMNSNLAVSMIGKNVVAAKFDDSGELVTTEGTVEKVMFTNGDFEYYIKGKAYKLNNIMEVKAAASSDSSKDTTGTTASETTAASTADTTTDGTAAQTGESV